MASSLLLGGLKAQGVEDVFVFCTKGELNKYRVPRLLQEYVGAGLSIHHYPFPDGLVPSLTNCLKMLEEIQLSLNQGKGTLVHCYGGIGRSALIAACLLLVLDDNLEWKGAIERVRELKGSRAIQTVKVRILYTWLFLRWLYFREFRESVFAKISTLIYMAIYSTVMKTSQKLQN